MSLSNRLKVLEQASSNKQDHKVEIYILGDSPDIDYWGKKIVHTVSPRDTVINITEDDEGEY